MSLAEKYRPYYTYDDYCQWEGSWELIEGMSYAMSPFTGAGTLECLRKFIYSSQGIFIQ